MTSLRLQVYGLAARLHREQHLGVIEASHLPGADAGSTVSAGMLAKPLVDDALATLQHEKGWFVMARLNHLPAAECEIAAVLRALTQHLPTLLHLHTKAGQLHKAAWRLVTPSLCSAFLMAYISTVSGSSCCIETASANCEVCHTIWRRCA